MAEVADQPGLWDEKTRRRRARRAKQGQRVNPLPDSSTLGECKQWVRAHVAEPPYEAVRCPCCGQNVKLYQNTISSGQARVAIEMYRRYRQEFVYLPDLRLAMKIQQNNEPMLRHWRLLVEEPIERPDGGRAGWWRLTDLGVQWVRGEATVPKYAVTFDNKCLRREGPPWSVRDALGKKFDLAELMGWVRR